MIKTALYVIHGILFTLTVLAAVYLHDIITPGCGSDEFGFGQPFGILTGLGVLISVALTFVYYEYYEDDNPFVTFVAPVFHASILVALIWAWVTYIPILFQG